jgi:hypothetical protein
VGRLDDQAGAGAELAIRSDVPVDHDDVAAGDVGVLSRRHALVLGLRDGLFRRVCRIIHNKSNAHYANPLAPSLPDFQIR